MKKFLSVVLAFLMLAVMLPTTALADETFENMVYSAHENDTINLGDGSFTIPSSAPDGQSGQSVPNNLTFVGNGADKTTCAVSGITSGESTATYFFDGGKKVTFKNVKIDFGPVSDFDGFIRAGDMTFENCIIKGMGANWGSGDVVFNNCTFQYPDTYNEWTYNLWTYSGKSFSFNGCTFETKLPQRSKLLQPIVLLQQRLLMILFSRIRPFLISETALLGISVLAALIQ